MTDADETAACVASANMTGAALQPCLGTATAAAHPEVTDLSLISRFHRAVQDRTVQFTTIRNGKL